MARIVHISDLHLGQPAHWQRIGDHKSKMAGGDERAQKDVFRETLDALVEEGELEDVDAIVVSGDLTNKSQRDGFDEFLELLATLKSVAPPGQIVVVPGNHDVPWDPGPLDPDRYTEFIRVTRREGLVTPLLDRIDFEPNGTLTAEAEKHPISCSRRTSRSFPSTRVISAGDWSP